MIPQPKIPDLTKDSYPNIVRFRYHFAAIYYSSSMAGLTEVSSCIRATVPADHPEFALLVEAGRQKRQELENKDKAAEK